MSVRMAEGVSAQVPADDFQALEEKVYRTIELYKSGREARAAAERDAQRLRQQLEEREEELESLRREMVRCARNARRFAAGWKRCWPRSNRFPKNRRSADRSSSVLRRNKYGNGHEAPRDQGPQQ